MVRDLRVLSSLRLKQFWDAAEYWLRVLGYPADASASVRWGYLAYIIGFLIFWVAAVWAYSFDQAKVIGDLLDANGVTSLIESFPVIVLLVQVFVLTVALRSTPLKLPFTDMAYVAASPVHRAAPVLLGFISQVALRWLLVAAITPLLLVVAAAGAENSSTLPEIDTVQTYLRVFAATVPLVLLTWGAAWVAGILRLIFPRIGQFRFLWTLPLIGFIIVRFIPELGLWPGQTLVLLAYNQDASLGLALMSILAVGSLALLVYLGGKINMIHAVDESRIYARIQALGLMAWRNPGLQARIRAQASFAGRKPFLRLPQAQGTWSPFVRAAVSYVRSPTLLLAAFLWGVLVTWIGAIIVYNDSPAPLWLAWLFVVGAIPPPGLLNVLQTDVESAFLRQFILFDGLTILIADTLIPMIVISLGGIGLLVLQGLPIDMLMLASAGVVAVTMLVTMAGGYALTRQRRILETRLLTVALSVLPAMVALANLHQPFLALGIAGGGIIILSGMVGADL